MMLSLKLVIWFVLVVLIGVYSVAVWRTKRRIRVSIPLKRTLSDDLAVQTQQFVSQLSHELRTPLTAMLSHAAVARNSATEPAIRERSLEILEHEATRLALLVRDLMELQRLQTSEHIDLHPLNSVMVVEEVMIGLLPMIETANASIDMQIDGELPLVLGHTERLKQAWINIISNALKYSQPGVTITITMCREAHGVRCQIHDNGPGIAAQHLPHVTERFYRGQRDRDGSGLGLALVKEIIEQHGSNLQIESSTTEPSGTNIWWILHAA